MYIRHISKSLNSENIIWKRYNTALIGLLAMKKDEQRQVEINSQLKRNLQDCEDGINVNDKVINNDNPLIVVNGKF